MDQLKTALSFVWQHRFWFAMGLAAIFATIVYPAGASRLYHTAKQKKAALDGIYKGLQPFSSGVHPNSKFIEKAETVKAKVDEAVGSVWEELYAKQKDLFTWPEKVSEKFFGRPFLSDLSFGNNEWLIIYYYSGTDDSFPYEDYFWSVWYEGDPLERVGEAVYGTAEIPNHVLHYVQWDPDTTPTSRQAWLAQEQLWVDREILRTVARLNAPVKDLETAAERWEKATVKGVVGIAIGGQASLDTQTLASGGQLINAMGEGQQQTLASAYQRGSASRGGVTGIVPDRYILQTEQFREIPVAVSLKVDQQKIEEVLVAFANMPFNFVIREAAVAVPDKPVQMPEVVRGEVGKQTDASQAVQDEASFSTVSLDIYGRVRLYYMPPSVKKNFEEANAPAQAEPAETQE